MAIVSTDVTGHEWHILTCAEHQEIANWASQDQESTTATRTIRTFSLWRAISAVIAFDELSYLVVGMIPFILGMTESILSGPIFLSQRAFRLNPCIFLPYRTSSVYLSIDFDPFYETVMCSVWRPTSCKAQLLIKTICCCTRKHEFRDFVINKPLICSEKKTRTKKEPSYEAHPISFSLDSLSQRSNYYWFWKNVNSSVGTYTIRFNQKYLRTKIISQK